MKANSIAKKLSLIVSFLMIAAFSGCQYILPKEEEPMAPPLVQPKDVVYTTVDVARGNIVNSIQGMGRVESVKMVDLYFESSGGRIKNINVKYGDKVKKGDVLLELDTGELDYQIQVAQLKYQEQQNDYNEHKSHMSRIDRQNAQIELQISQLGIDQLEKEKTDATLISPIDGSVVYITDANQGSSVDAYSTLVRIADPSVKMLEYEDDSNRGFFQIGMTVQVSLKSGGSVIQGTVVSTPLDREKYNTEDLAKLLFIQVPDEFLANLNIGDEVKVVLVLAERDNVLWLPRNVVQTYQQRRYVDVLDSNNVKTEKDVEVGLETATQTEILSGLSEGDKVVVR